MKTVMIIGAGKGLGNAVAERFALENFKVILISRNQENLAKYKKEFSKKNIDVIIQKADVSDFISFTEVFDNLIKDHGTPDVVFYNVGITLPDSEVKVTPELLVERYKNDVVGAYNCINLLDTSEFSKKKGSILVTGGIFGVNPYAPYLPLSMDKAALRAMITALAPVYAEKNIFLGTIQISGEIGSNDKYAPQVIAEKFWKLYQSQEDNEIFY